MIANDGIGVDDHVGVDHAGLPNANTISQDHAVHEDRVLSKTHLLTRMVGPAHGIGKGLVPTYQSIVCIKGAFA